ncbi:MAG: hypothetical protein P8X85_09840 [Desulfobacterales bacterium]
MLKVGIKYCGGCNPYYDRVALVKQIESRLRGKVEFVSPDGDHVDLVLAVEGCQTACADLSSFQGKTIHIISQKEDVGYFLQKILNQHR